MSYTRCTRWISSLTSKRYPDITRTKHFTYLDDIHIQTFRNILNKSSSVITDPSDVESYNMDWLNSYSGQAVLVLKPNTTDQVSKILKYCNENSLAITPQGGNTGLVGGSVPVFDEIIISMSNMNRIIHFDPISSVLTCEAGCILQMLDEWLKENHNHCMPLDLGAKGSCQIGGNVATNAGGVRLLRYGSLHGSILGLEAVLADGTILNNMNALRKDNTGYDLKQLFIGSEGTLGIITQINIATPHRPKSTNTVILSLDSFELLQKLLFMAKKHLSDILSAFEFWDKGSAILAQKYYPDLEEFGKLNGSFYVLIETFHYDDEKDRLIAFLGKAIEENICEDGIVAETELQKQAMWKFRECLPETNSREGYVYKYDISLSTSLMYDLVQKMKDRVESDNVLVVGYGHAGDGNVHLNIIDVGNRKFNQKLLCLIEPFVYEYTQMHNGSISAEHGLGIMKTFKLHYSKRPEMIEYMRKIKNLLDPKGILNPYKVIQ